MEIVIKDWQDKNYVRIQYECLIFEKAKSINKPRLLMNNARQNCKRITQNLYWQCLNLKFGIEFGQNDNKQWIIVGWRTVVKYCIMLVYCEIYVHMKVFREAQTQK